MLETTLIMVEYAFQIGKQFAMSNASLPGYIVDILDQPKALRTGLSAWKGLEFKPIAASVRRSERVILTGMGSSYAALLPAWRSLIKAGIAAWHLDTAELLTLGSDFLAPNTLVIAASQSGRSAELIALSEQARGRSPLIAMTNDPASPMTQGAAHVMELYSGVEHAVSTRSYLNTLALASILGSAVYDESERDPWARAMKPWVDTPDPIERYLERWRARVDALKAALGLPDRLILLARGASLASAFYGALINKEAAKWPLEAMNAAQFRHGPLELADSRLTALILAGNEPADRERNRRLARDVHRYGGRVLWLESEGEGLTSGQSNASAEACESLSPGRELPTVPTSALPTFHFPHVPSFARAAAEILPLQLLSVALAELTGIEPGVFRHLQKVTSVE